MGEEFRWRTQTQLKIYFSVSIMILCNVEPSTQSSDANCIFYNEEFMECTWAHSEGEVNYTLYHWYNTEPPQECRNHIQQHGYNVGCHFSASEIKQFTDFYIFRNGSNGSGDISREPQKFQLQNQVKPFAPGNLVVNATENNGLLLSWHSPMPAVACLEFEVRYRNMDKEWQKAFVLQQTNFNLPSVDPEKLYTFQVKSKVNKYCGTTKLWSEWSPPVHWGRNDTGSA
ncbi:cytokine receptor common subunit gamma-like isoform X2 [Rhinoraja longicauda]